MEKEKINEIFDKLSDLRVLLLGETILDQYCFVTPTGRATKDPILSTRVCSKETYLGGILATASHLSNFVKEVRVITLLGDQNKYDEFIKKKLDPRIKLEIFTKENSTTIIKRRYIEPFKFTKLFKTEFMDETIIPSELSKKISERVNELKNSYDLILINDFGHGFFDNNLIDTLTQSGKFLGINVQTNSSNFGFNPVTKFPSADFLSLNQTELRIVFHTKSCEDEALLERLVNMGKYKEILLTLGRRGCIYHRTKSNNSPAFVTKTIDTVGAGDATFAITSLLAFKGIDEELVPSISSAVGAVAVDIVGNKEYVKKEDLIKHLISGKRQA